MAVKMTNTPIITVDQPLRLTPLADAGKDETNGWNKYLANHPDSDICHHSAWGKIYNETFGHNAILLIYEEEGNIKGGVPLVPLDLWTTGKAMVSMPYLNYGGLLADDDTARKALIDGLNRIIKTGQLGYIELRQIRTGSPDLVDQTKQTRATFWLDINRPTDQIMSGLKKQLRTRIRKSQKNDLEILTGKKHVNMFYKLFATAQKEHGTPTMPRRFFESIVRHLGDHIEIMIAKKDGLPVGGKMFMKFKNRLTMTWGCFPNRHKHLLANYFMTWNLIEKYAQTEIKTLDFGRSPYDSGGFINKTNWGTEVVPLCFDYLCSSPDKIPNLRPDGAGGKIQTAISIWKKLPLPLTIAIGSKLSRYFP